MLPPGAVRAPLGAERPHVLHLQSARLFSALKSPDGDGGLLLVQRAQEPRKESRSDLIGASKEAPAPRI